ncbi:F-box/LRR-repeat protein 12-like [Thrips palmi]|uniref:F-box/LRR-repeat protein 12-like n=1 Tax=Thrips palmi TaxID=161013 RepID=A0A6P9ACX1_THRPL|nr:F-box/LRR-repeat protein 12-like [Thrips palmi]
MATLPDLALLRVFEYVAADNLDDLVSAGQVCRHWRRVAASEQLWRRRRLKCHGMATEAFTRVVSFAPRLHSLDVCWINQISPEDRVIRKRALLASRSKLRRLTGVMCHRDSDWTHGLLALHAEHLRELEVSTADREALQAVGNMPLLHALHVSGWDPGLEKDPYIYPARPDGPNRGPNTGTRVTGEDRGLERLEVRGLPKETTVSMLRANRRSLRKLTLNVGTPSDQHNAPGWPKTCSDLAQLLQACGLQNLKEITLTRYGGCFHSDTDCMKQRKSLEQHLECCNVQCSDCNPFSFA